MTTFDERESAFEQKFAHDQEMLFRATAHRNRAVGLWAAQKLGMSGTDAESYAKSVVAAGIAAGGDAVVLDRIGGDFRAAGLSVRHDETQTALTLFMSEAVEAQTKL